MLSFKDKKVLIIAPHPDDEVIGCGGLISKIKEGGGKVYVLFLTNGDTNDFSKAGISTSKQRNGEIEQVAKFLKFDDYHLALPGNLHHLKLDLAGQLKLMGIIERDSPVSIEKVKPSIVAFPFPDSYNQDHRIAAHATHAALRPASDKFKHFVPTAISYESPAEQWRFKEQEINFFVPLTTGQLAAKTSALKLYRSQIRQEPHPRSIEIVKALAVIRGAQCGNNFAEGFKIHRGML